MRSTTGRIVSLLEAVNTQLMAIKPTNLKKMPKTAPKASSNSKASMAAAKKKLEKLKAMSKKGVGKATTIKAYGTKKGK